MNRRLNLPLLAFLTLAAASACEVDEEAGEAVTAEDTVPAAEPVTEAPGASIGATLAVDTLEGAGPYLTDADGRALYLLEADPQGRSTCQGECAEEWPPLLARTASPAGGTMGLREDLIGTTQRPDGQTQITYGGHPLYYYHDDAGAGSTLGQDVTDQWGEWYLVKPDGEPLETSPEGAA